MCLAEPGPDEALEPYAGMEVCGGCREDHRASARVWGLELAAGTREQRGYRSSYMVSTSRVNLATRLDMHAILCSREQSSDHDYHPVDDLFDGQVLADSVTGSVTMDLLADPGVQAVVIEATGAASEVVLMSQRVVLTRRADSSFDIEELDRMDRAAVALAVGIERWARGAPGSTSFQPGCGPAMPEEPRPVDLGPDEFRTGRQAKDCPTCGEPMVAADLEDICARCGTSHEIEGAGKIRRRRRLKAVFIGALVVAVIIGMIAIMAAGKPA